jgi:hypothetical protein
MTTLSIHTRIVSAAALAGLMSALLLPAANRADARVVLTECQRKHSFCAERCIMNNKNKGVIDDAAGRCIKRTCDKQHSGCGSSTGSAKSGGKRIDAGSTDKPPVAGGATPKQPVVTGTTPKPSGAGAVPRTPGGVKVTTTGGAGETAPRSGGGRSGARR